MAQMECFKESGGSEKFTDLENFFRSKVRVDVEDKLVVSERFVDDEGKPLKFVIRGVSEAENESLKLAARRHMGGELKFDSKNYCNRLIVAATKYPNFRSLELQRSWGAINAEDLVCRMLLAGEYTALLSAVKKLSGFDEDVYRVKDTVKNS